jgi:hypothetical protein
MRFASRCTSAAALPAAIDRMLSHHSSTPHSSSAGATLSVRRISTPNAATFATADM